MPSFPASMHISPLSSFTLHLQSLCLVSLFSPLHSFHYFYSCLRTCLPVLQQQFGLAPCWNTAQVGVIVKLGKILLFSNNSDCLLPLFGHHYYVQLVRHHQFDLLTLEVPQDHPRGHRSSCILCPLLGYDAPCTVCPACQRLAPFCNVLNYFRSISAQTAPWVLP